MRFITTRRTSIRSVGTVCAAASLLVALTGCGGDSKAADVQKSADYLTCLGKLEHQRTTTALRRLIAEGKFSKSEIVRQFPSSMAQNRYLQTDGNLRPFAELPTDAKTAVIDWIDSLEGKGGLGEQLYQAEQRADDAAKTACGKFS